MNEHARGNYVLKFNNLPLGTYNPSVGVSDNINVNEYWTEPENKITNEFKDDFEDTGFSLAVWSPTKGNWHIHIGSDNYLWTTSPTPDSYDPVTQMRRTSNWTEYSRGWYHIHGRIQPLQVQMPCIKKLLCGRL